MKALVVVAAIAAVVAYQAMANCGKCSEGAKSGGDKACPEGACASVLEKADVAKAPVNTEAHPTLEVSALATLLKAGTPLVLLDARAGKWDDGRRIPGAKSLNAESPEKDVAAVIPAKDSLVITYCTNLKCQASPKLAKHLRELGYSNVIELPVGIDGWEAAGQKVDKTEVKK
jgi:rhodanese-related sulfurtransferase